MAPLSAQTQLLQLGQYPIPMGCAPVYTPTGGTAPKLGLGLPYICGDLILDLVFSDQLQGLITLDAAAQDSLNRIELQGLNHLIELFPKPVVLNKNQCRGVFCTKNTGVPSQNNPSLTSAFTQQPSWQELGQINGIVA
jgi:hypothetical protein